MRRTRPAWSLYIAAALAIAACGGPGGGRTTGSTSITPRPHGKGPIDEASPEDQGELPEPPLGRLPRDVRPQHYLLSLTIVPSEDRFAGVAHITVTLEERKRLIWMHGRDLEVEEADIVPEEGKPIGAEWEQMHEQGVVALRPDEPVGPGKATIKIDYTAAYNDQLKGLYRVRHEEQAYAFTQFQPLSARAAFPCFDEPSFKTPFDISLTVDEDHVAATATPVVEKQSVEGGRKRLRYATTKPLPTYLVAFAVGPFDVVEAEGGLASTKWRDRKVPFRALAVEGKGSELRYAIEHTPALLERLEKYFAEGYPYAKLDVVAVPDFAAGAMENVGLVTFRDTLLLLGENPPVWQKRAFAHVMAHELAHMWFGNLVTMPWWNDIWLNEAFATWMGHKVVADVRPEYNAQLRMRTSVLEAMKEDSLASARQIRQPIEDSHDIRNAFDAITYRKGGGVLSMFERWLGEDTFRTGIRRYIERHREGTATAEDLLETLSSVSDKAVKKPFQTFLEQPGLPFLDLEPQCSEDGEANLTVEQRRYLPVGSEAKSGLTWQLPMCVRYGVDGETHAQCTLVEDTTTDMNLAQGCPRWIMPNADGAGYYRFALPADELEALRSRGWSKLADREKLAVADSIRAAFHNASVDADGVYGGLERFARSKIRPVAEVPIDLISFAHDDLVGEDLRPEVRTYGRRLYRPVFRKLGWSEDEEESGETKLRRARILEFLTLRMDDPALRKQAARRGRRYLGYGDDGELNPDVVGGNLVKTVLAVAAQRGDVKLFEAMVERLFDTDDSLLRARLLRAIAHVTGPKLARRARELALDDRLKVNEVHVPLQVQLEMPETRDAAWTWLTEHFDEVVGRTSDYVAGRSPRLTAKFCSEDKAKAIASFFEERIEELPGGPRNLRVALERIRLCAALVDAQRDGAKVAFED